MPNAPLALSYDKTTGILRIDVTGPWPTGKEAPEFVDALARSGAPEDAPVLVDLRRVEAGTEPRYAELATRARDGKLGGPRRRAYLTRPGTQYGTARMIQALLPSGVEMEIFVDENEALAWLRTAV